jgi:hypothetical protein
MGSSQFSMRSFLINIRIVKIKKFKVAIIAALSGTLISLSAYAAPKFDCGFDRDNEFVCVGCEGGKCYVCTEARPCHF